MGAEKAVIIAVCAGWGNANIVRGDRADKVMEGASEGINVGPRVVVNGLNKMAKRAMMYWSWQIGGVSLWVGWM